MKHNHNHKNQHNHHNHHKMMIDDFKKRFWITLALTLPIILMAPMLQNLAGLTFRFPGDRWLQLAIASIIFIYGGWPFLKGLVDEIKKKQPGMMTLIALAISVAYLYSAAVVLGLQGRIFFWELASLIVIMLLGHWLEMKSVMGASNALEELANLMPSTANLLVEGNKTREVAIDDLKNGDRILVKPGEKIPADGKITEGNSRINEAMLTGESKPVSKKAGDEVFGGSINENGAVQIQVKNTGSDSYLSQVIKMVKQAQDAKSKTQNLADKAAAWLFYLALSAGIITLSAWLLAGKNFDFALERMVTVMIISCPHALGLAIPLVVAISTAESAKNGLLIRNRTAFENARKLTTVVFDKTGTLTKGKFGVSRFKSVDSQLSDEEILKLAAAVEQNSEHPIGAGILQKAQAMGLDVPEINSFEQLTGKGVSAIIDQEKIMVLSPDAVRNMDLKIPEGAFGSGDETVVFVIKNKEMAGYLALSDELRADAKTAVKMLKAKGIKVMMATGDNEQVAKAVSDALQLDHYYAEVLPEDKQKIVTDLQADGAFVAMTGDGVNDAPALAQANVGIAVGSGTDVAAETADIVLVNSNPKDIANLILFGAATYKKMMQNIWWAAGYNIVAVPLAAGVLYSAGIVLSPAVGAALMSLSTIIVAFNARLLKNKLN